MNNEPVAIRYGFDGYGYQYMDSGSGSDWLTRVDGELLYTHPAKTPMLVLDGNRVYPTAKTLTDEEIVSLYESSYLESGLDEWEFDPVYFARAILRKAQE
jgi:hypothetical protein